MIQNLDWWLFLVIGSLVYWLAPARFRPLLLAGGSLGFLVFQDPRALALMVALSIAVYLGLSPSAVPVPQWLANLSRHLPLSMTRIRRSTWCFFVVLIYLFWFKYTPKFAELLDLNKSFKDLSTPIGISYFSFKLMHYALERGRGTLEPHRFQDFISWMFLMPIFTSGPIERFDHYQANRENTFKFDFVVEGLTRIIQGLVKQFILFRKVQEWGNSLSGDNLVAFAHGTGGTPGVLAVWAFFLCSTMGLYLNFSAYTDLAIGASRLFGLRIGENFNYPFLATNIVDFWRRWHMSLTNWCRAYVYMPMVGISRNPYLAVIVTFSLVGLWHAGTLGWLAWGLWQGIGQAISLRWSRYAQQKKITFFKTQIGKITGWAMTMAYVLLGDCLSSFETTGTFSDAFRLMARAVGI